MNLLRLILVACLAAIVNCDTSNDAADVGKCKEGEDGEGCADVTKKSKDELAKERKEANERRKVEREERKKKKEAEKKAKREAREKQDREKNKKKNKGKKQDKKKSSGKNKKKKESKKKEEKPKKKDKKKDEKKKKEQAKKEEEKKKQQQKKEKEEKKKKTKKETEEEKKKKQEKKKKDEDKKKQKKKKEQQKKKEEKKKKKEKEEKAKRKAEKAKKNKENKKEKKARRALNARKSKLDFGGIWGSRALDYCDALVAEHEHKDEIHEDTCAILYRIIYDHYNEYANIGINGMLGKMFGSAMNLKVPGQKDGPGSGRMKQLVERQPWYDAALRVVKVSAWATIEDQFNETIIAMEPKKAFEQRETTIKKHGMPLLFLAQQGQANDKLYSMYMDHEVFDDDPNYGETQVFTYRPVPKATVLGVGYKPEEGEGDDDGDDDDDEDIEDLDELNDLMADM